MNKKILLIIVCLFITGIQTTFSQEIKNEPQKPYHIGSPSKVEQVASIASRANNLARPDLSAQKEMLDKRSSKYDIIIGKGSEGDDALASYKDDYKNRIPTRTPELVFETGASNSSPTDPSGAVGPNHYISVINSAYQIFDKSGNSLTGGLLAPSTIFTFADGGCCDLTASYDNLANKWILSYLSTSLGTQVAVSNGPDPVNDGWTVYTLSSVSDYQKLSVWRDGYYMTENTSSGNKLHVFERSAMIDAASAGTTPQILSFSMPGLVTSGFHSFQVLNISDDNWPTSGGATAVYMQDDAWGGVTSDHIKIWSIDMDWTTPANSVVSAATEIPVTDFVSVFDGGGFSNLSQPNGGATIDALQATVMNQSQYRKFPTYNSAVFNFVVDVDGSANKQAGVRWYELRQTADGQPWTIHQEGTYTAPDNRHAWNASLIMDSFGNIGMGYTGMSSPNSTNQNIMVGSYYTGRFSTDALNTMTVAEGTIMAGNANIPGTRYGDYSKIDIDPENDKKFWFINEVMSSGRKNVAGVFQIAPNFSNDIGIISIDNPNTGILTSTESITVTIRNFGLNAASGFNVTYQINGGALVSEVYSGTIASNESAQYTFTATGDFSTEGQTYNIVASTVLTGDEDPASDSMNKQVIHDLAKDLGVTAITSPDSGETIGSEAITITIENFGAAAQSNFNVSYTINGGTAVTENISSSLAPSGTMSHTFATLGNFSTDGAYMVVAKTLLTGDSNSSNDASQRTVSNFACNNDTNSTSMTVGPNAGTVTESVITITEDNVISDLNVTLNINHEFNADLDIKLIGPDGTEVILFEDIGGSSDNFTNTVLDDAASNAINTGSAPFTGTFQPQGNLSDFNGLQSAGDWTLSITDDGAGDGGELISWSIKICENFALSVTDNELDGDFKILNTGNNQYVVSLTSATLLEDLELNVYNMTGQKLLWRTLENNAGTYSYNLNMSYASSGVYLLRLGNNKNATIKRFVVE